MVLGRLAHLAGANGARIPSIADDDFTDSYSDFSRAFADRRYGLDCMRVVMGGIVLRPIAHENGLVESGSPVNLAIAGTHGAEC